MMCTSHKFCWNDMKGVVFSRSYDGSRDCVDVSKQASKMIIHMLLSAREDAELTVIPPIEGPCPRVVAVVHSAKEQAGDFFLKKGYRTEFYIFICDRFRKAYWTLPLWIDGKIEDSQGRITSLGVVNEHWNWCQLSQEVKFVHFCSQLNRRQSFFFQDSMAPSYSLLNSVDNAFDFSESLLLDSEEYS